MRFIVTLIFLFPFCNAYFEYREISNNIGKKLSIIKNAVITITKQQEPQNVIPQEFKCDFNDENNNQISFIFERVVGLVNKIPSKVSNIYTEGTDGKLNLADTKTNDNIETYRSTDSSATATVVENIDLNGLISDKLRYLITVTGNQTEYDIVPVLTRTSILLKNGQIRSSTSISHSVQTRDSSETSFLGDYTIADALKNGKYNIDELQRTERSVNGGPVYAYTECVLVADYSAYVKAQTISNSTDMNFVFSFMKIYYSHVMSSANLRYLNSFANDQDINLQIRLTNFVFLTTPPAWSSTANVGVPGYTTYTAYKGVTREVVQATPILTAFRSYMESQVFSFTYDHAIAIINKDLWSDDSTVGPEYRTGVAGFAYVGTVCSSYRYSIVEDDGFQSSLLIAHEVGHSLGAVHDGTSFSGFDSRACLASENYVMTANSGFYKGNAQNYYRFSNCSILNMKLNLLNNNGPLKSAFNCIANLPVNFAIEISYFNNSLSGQLFNSDDQCKFINGPTSRYCSLGSICDTLWCYTPNGLQCTSLAGWGAVEGTICGTNMVCQNAACVSNSGLLATNFPKDACLSNTFCLNGGTCTQISSFPICTCTKNFTGLKCETLLMSYNSTTILGSTTAAKTSTVTTSTKTTRTLTSSTTTSSRLTTITASTKTSTVTTSSKTTSTLTSTTGTKCLDSDSNICPQYAAVGYCVYSSVQNYCRLSCKICIKPITVTSTSTITTSSTTTKCLDSDSNICPLYAAAGYCGFYSSVQNYCPLSCKMCIKPITTTSTSTTKTSSTTAKCLDSDSNICPQYAAVGYCVYSSVQNYCRLSCKLCS